MNVNRWASRYYESIPNPGAGFVIGRVHGERSEDSMATNVAQAPSKSLASWHPTVANLAVLVLLELAGYAAFRYFFRTVHGG